jgi:hypothetical protein
MLFTKRQLNAEYAAVLIGFLQPNTPVMQIRNTLRNCESEARTAPRAGLLSRSRLIGAVEAIEYIRLICRGNSAPCISYTDSVPAA